ncbi:hypothetical protein ACIGW3_08595 [Streptomyces sp. NPDC053499]|uniref:pPIWI-associating nuclease domain-containing protein n=1 Tax=Streptomyces sp. NPDC053499 TaxID=3365707 RepID=UPI0037D762C0
MSDELNHESSVPGEGSEDSESEPSDESQSRGQLVPRKAILSSGSGFPSPAQGPLREFLRSQATFAELKRSLFRPAALHVQLPQLQHIAATMRAMDQLRVDPLREHRESLARLSETHLGLTSVTSWRVALQANNIITQYAQMRTAQSELHKSLFRQLSAVSRIQVNLADWLVQQRSIKNPVLDFNGQTLSAWRDHVASLSSTPTVAELRVSTAAGYSSTGLLGADALTADTGEDEETSAELVDRVEGDVISAWETSRLRASGELRETLSTLHPKTPDFLDGAWELLAGDNPVAAELVANCVVEAIDRILRIAAPDEEVKAWLPSSNRPQSEWYSDAGRLQRAMRIRYIAAQKESDVKLVMPLAESLVTLSSVLMRRAQGVKHAKEVDLVRARAMLVSAENFLITLFVC